MALKDWKLMKVAKNHKGIIIGKIWIKKSDREQQLSLVTIMPYAHVLSFMGWCEKTLGTFKTFKEGEIFAKKYMSLFSMTFANPI